jgi:hypothetical protein
VVFTVPLVHARPSPSDGCKQTPYCLQHARHSLLWRGRLATVVNKPHIAYSMHVTIYTLRKQAAFVKNDSFVWITQWFIVIQIRVRLGVLKEVTMKSIIFWDMTPRSPIEVILAFRMKVLHPSSVSTTKSNNKEQTELLFAR